MLLPGPSKGCQMDGAKGAKGATKQPLRVQTPPLGGKSNRKFAMAQSAIPKLGDFARSSSWSFQTS